MEVDPKKQKDLMVYIFKELKTLDTDLSAFRTVLHAIKFTAPEIAAMIELGLERTLPIVRKQMDEKYDAILERLAKRFDEAALQSDLEQFLREWKPTGPTN